MKLSLSSLGAEPGARFLEQVKLAELLGFHAYFHEDKTSARELFARLGAATQVTTRCAAAFFRASDAAGLAHVPERWKPVFR